MSDEKRLIGHAPFPVAAATLGSAHVAGYGADLPHKEETVHHEMSADSIGDRSLRTTMEHPNATRMRQTVGAFMAGDIPLLLEGFADNVVWYSPGDTPASGRLRGREGVLRFFTMMDEASGGTLRIEADDVLARDRYVTTFLTVTARRHSERMSVVVAQLAEVDEHGKWSRFWFLPDKLDEWNGFFAAANSESH